MFAKRPDFDWDEFLAGTANENGVGPVQCRERLGGMLRFYNRDAA
jgi:hypothetical protein